MQSKVFTKSDFAQLDKRFRTTFLNSISGLKNACLVGTKSKDGLLNLAIFNSLVHVGADPPLLGLVFRPDSVERHTFSNILESTEYTINLVSSSFTEKAHQTSARYPKVDSEFVECGLSPAFHPNFGAPFVAESPVRIGLSLKEVLPIQSNGTHFLIGEIQWIDCPEDAIQSDGYADLGSLDVVGCIGIDAYVQIAKTTRYAYAKPNVEPKSIEL